MKKIKNILIALAGCIAVVCFFGSHVSAQDSTKIGKWNFVVEPYLMFPYMDGETGIGNSLILPVDASPGDIFSKLQIGAMLYLEANTEKWAITSDVVYMNLKQEATPGMVLISGSVTAKQFIWEAAGLYRINSFLEIGLGGRLNSLETSVKATIKEILPPGTKEVSGSEQKTWYDPILVARYMTSIQDKWFFQARGDLGGFGIGSSFTWQLQAYAGYRFSKLFQLTAGYRIISTDYSTGEAPKDFLFDVREFGPSIRFGFHF